MARTPEQTARIRARQRAYLMAYAAFASSKSTAWTPLRLFANGEQGAWYDPSDLTTLFQDAAGTTPVTEVEQKVGLIRDKSGNGNHASQITDTGKPTLSARVNQFTYTEDFSNAAWKTFGGATKISSTAIRVTTADTGSNVYQEFTAANTNASSYVFSVEVKRNAATDQTFQLFQNIRGVTPFGRSGDLVATAEWQRFTLTHTSSGGTGTSVFGIIGNTSGTQADLLVRNADLRPANAGVGLPAYQRVGAATDYDTTGFPTFLSFDGTDDGLVTSAINFSGTDKMSVFAGLRKLSDAARGSVVELTASAAANNGAFHLTAPNAASATMAFESKGTALTDAVASSLTAPLTRVVTGLGDISGDTTTIRVNAVQADQDTGDQGTGNYSNAILYIGRRGGASLPFNGNIYGLIIRGAVTSSTDISSAETWMATKTGVTL